ncbi:MAG: dicarboxylate/amino acid:cation symporter [Sphingorhabdus sp.]|jgi:Na+/H+-dicarboxylate symporter|uniref:dicarboxylate/amino acid:cation symporter n=1 Tax=Sphingorhabdus sp. TaxID=1902408 RepID=UPI00273DE4F1|nr:cation:dicarboxylase symporter family transporter [Sphingorhabdus sp.]MDP4872545.1 dicarboxylate/amino acid:cation symporter [Sphingorhabdus sp.]MDP4926529.1 dicarboxylate/amino acid:cation symporter [Sphingorhabdus sp.]
MSNATRILLALFIGLALGVIAAAQAPVIGVQIAYWLDIVGSLWLNGLRMTVVPLVVALLVTGIVKSAEAARAGPMAARTVFWVVCLMIISAVLGAVLTPALLSLWPMPAESAAALRAALTTVPAVAEQPPLRDFIVALVPTNPISSAANDSILPLLIFTLVFAFAVTRLAQEPRAQMAGFFSALADAMVIVIEWVLKLAPIGVFALAFVVGARSGLAALGAVAHYIVTVSIVGIIVGAFAYPIAVFAGKVRLGEFVRQIAPVQAFAVSTQSSLASLPLMLKKAEALGVRESTAGLVLPMAVALLRVTGPAMNLAVALYVANWFGVELDAFDYGFAIFIAALTSMGAVSLPGSVSFVTSIAPICLALGIPIEPLALLIAVETLPDIFRTTGNVQMDVALATVIEAPEKEKANALS